MILTSIVTKELATRIETSEIECLFSRLTAIKEMKGNPMGVDIQQFGNATAFSVKNIPGPSFNVVKGLAVEDVPYVEQIIDFYNEKGIPVQFEVTPAHSSPELLARLHELGLYQSDFHTTLFKPVDRSSIVEKSTSPILIRELGQSEFDQFADIYTKGFQMPNFLRSGVAQNNEVLHHHPNWTFYLASMMDKPVGIGVLFMKNRVANLAAAATLPAFRNNGVHRSLIQKRINHAVGDSCDLIVGQASFGSVSQNNMERANMKIGYMKVIWVKE